MTKLIQESVEKEEGKNKKEEESTAKRRRIGEDEILKSAQREPQDPGNNPGIPESPSTPKQIHNPDLKQSVPGARPEYPNDRSGMYGSSAGPGNQPGEI